MPELAEIIKKSRELKGTQVAIAMQLSETKAAKKHNWKVSSQSLGQYEAGEKKPKAAFFLAWKEAFKEDLLADDGETNVSHETENLTPVDKSSDNTEKSLGELEAYRKLFEGRTEYLVIPRKVLEKTQLISIDELDNKNKQIDMLIKLLGVELSKVPGFQNDKKKT
jgi:transcriptional regulator with XRE-family HTH domain